jgi:hypothetical protein
MRDQMRSLRAAALLPHVSLRVLPLGAGALPVGNMFIILGFGRETMPDLVYLESLTGELILDGAEELRAYNAAFALLSEMAASELETLDLITSIEHDYTRH